METKICKICLETKPLEMFVKRSKTTYRNECKKCYNLKKRKTPVKPTPKDGYKICAKCNKEKHLSDFNVRFMTNINKYRPFSYCKECERKYNNNRYSHTCEKCGKQYTSGRKDSKICVSCHRELMCQNKIMYKYKKRDFAGEKNPMFGKQRFGQENPNYKHGISEEERYKKRLITGYGIWRKKVYERDNYTCQCCGKKSNGDIVAHHLDGYSWCKEKRTDINNGITLCNSCHDEFHSIYGKFNNTKEQFYEFLNIKLEHLSS